MLHTYRMCLSRFQETWLLLFLNLFNLVQTKDFFLDPCQLNKPHLQDATTLLEQQNKDDSQQSGEQTTIFTTLDGQQVSLVEQHESQDGNSQQLVFQQSGTQDAAEEFVAHLARNQATAEGQVQEGEGTVLEGEDASQIVMMVDQEGGEGQQVRAI